MMKVVLLYLFFLSIIVNEGRGYKQPSEDDFNAYSQLVSALENDSYSFYIIKDLFFPITGPSPLCTPIRLQLICDNGSSYNYSSLWTQYDSNSTVGQILISFAYYGIMVDGFDWGDTCRFFRDIQQESQLPVVRLQVINCSDSNSLMAQLPRFVASLRGYASKKPDDLHLSGSDISSYRGYAIEWIEEGEDHQIFHSSYAILATLIVVLDLFIFFFSVGLCTNVYDSVYEHIKCKKNPYYPLFWALVVFAFVWNVLPGWYILYTGEVHVRASLGVMIPIQFALALLMRKYPDFPIPGMNWKKLSLQYQGYLIKSADNHGNNDKKSKRVKPHHYFFWEACRLRFPVRVCFSFIIQTLAVCTMLIFFTYLAIYTVAITISLYLYPLETLVKVIFVKAVAMCTIFGIAILFSAQSFQCAFTKRSIYTNITLIGQLLAVLSFLPLLAFLVYIIGGIIFTDSPNSLTGVQGILTLLPSVFLVLVGWYTRGKIFPEKIVADDSISDVEKNEQEVAESPTIQSEDHSNDADRHRPSLAEKARAMSESMPSTSYGSTEPNKFSESSSLLVSVPSSKAV